MNAFPSSKLKKHTVKIGSGVTPKGGEAVYQAQGIPLIRSQNVLVNQLDLSDVAFIDNEQHEKMSGSKILPGDVLLNITGASIGRSCVVPSNITDANVNQHVCIIRLKQSIDGRLLSLFLNSLYGQKQIWSFQGGGSREALNFQQIGNFDIPLPPLPEQKAIADLLSTWDEAIEKTERLIQAKERHFRWLLRELMTPVTASSEKAASPNAKSRMLNDELKNNSHLSTHNSKFANGACTEWKKVKLGDLFEKEIKVEKGKALTKESNTEGNVPVVAGGQTYAYFTNRPTHEVPSVTVSASGAYAGFVWYHDYPIWASDCNILHATKGVTKFLYFTLKAIQHRIYALQSGGAQPHVYSKDMKNLHVLWPSIEEQQEIAETLSSAQQEIDLLKQLADKYKTQKRGLMQKMLTGEWRVRGFAEC